MTNHEVNDPEPETGGERFCSDHGDSIRHEAHEWVRFLGYRKSRRIRYTCPGSTLGKYASRAERRADIDDTKETGQ